MGAVSIISYRILVEVNKHVCRTVLYYANWNIMDNTVYSLHNKTQLQFHKTVMEYNLPTAV